MLVLAGHEVTPGVSSAGDHGVSAERVRIWLLALLSLLWLHTKLVAPKFDKLSEPWCQLCKALRTP